MSTARRYRHTYDEYLKLGAESPLKLEFSDGEIFAMAGGTPENGALAMQLVVLVAPLLPAGCRTFSSDVKVRVVVTDLGTYPDLSVVCGPIERAEDDRNAITNPRFLFEITSPSTEEYDRGDKLSQYKQLASLEAVYLISHRRKEITFVRREPSGFTEKVFRGGEQAPLLGASVDVDALYSVLQDLG